MTQETRRLLAALRAEPRPANRAALLADLRAERLADWPADLRAERLADLLADLRADLRAEWPAGLPAEVRADLLADLRADRLAERLAEARAAQSPGEAEGLRLRAARVASAWQRIWRRFGFFLPSRSRDKILEPVLAEHAADFFEALSMAASRGEQDRLIVRFTIAAFMKVLICYKIMFGLDRIGKRVESGRPRRGTSSVWARCRLHLDRLDRYHGAGALVMTCGSVGMIASAFLAIVPLWAGFLAGVLPSLLLTTLVHPEHA